MKPQFQTGTRKKNKDRTITELVLKYPGITKTGLMEKSGKALRTVERHLQAALASGEIDQVSTEGGRGIQATYFPPGTNPVTNPVINPVKKPRQNPVTETPSPTQETPSQIVKPLVETPSPVVSTLLTTKKIEKEKIKDSLSSLSSFSSEVQTNLNTNADRFSGMSPATGGEIEEPQPVQEQDRLSWLEDFRAKAGLAWVN